MRRRLKAAALAPLIPWLVAIPALAEAPVPSRTDLTSSPVVPSLTAQNPSTGKSWANARPVLTLPLRESSQVAFSPNGQTLATGTRASASDNLNDVPNPHTIKLWNLNTGELIKTLSSTSESGLIALTFSPNGQILASSHLAAEDGTQLVTLLDVKTGQELQTLRGVALPPPDPTSSFYYPSIRLAFSPDGQTLVTVAANNPTIQVWDVSSQSLKEASSSEREVPRRILNSHTGAVSFVTFSPDGQFLVSGSSDQTIKLWNAKTGQLIRTLKGHTDGIRWLAISPDSQSLASIGSMNDLAIRLWNLQTGQPIRTLVNEVDMSSINFIFDAKNLIDTSRVPNSVELRVQVWDVKTGKVVHRSRNITWRATLDVNPDGKTYVTAGVGAIFEIRDLMTDEVIKDFGTEENVALFSPDGQSLMTQGSLGTRIWR
jgi:WD40 repeat protein